MNEHPQIQSACEGDYFPVSTVSHCSSTFFLHRAPLPTTDLECVMSSWWLASEAGAGEAAVEDVVAVLE
ncbi:hypothetical protein ACFYM2_30615, partial [Streptomyces sp. NPDC006711]|uniref:hypothetical protein n=1 Tax=Streptomyces sp. NPDC006711 TaxID=3364762 RepID=UPI0036922365